MALKRNLVANYIGQGWTALMGLAFIPLYVKYLGIEAYGLVGLFAVMQVWLSLLDMGLTPTLGREMARFPGGGHSPQSIRDLLRSVEIIALVVAALVAAAFATTAPLLASQWLRVEKIPLPVVAQAVTIMGLVAALRLVEGIYRSCITGLQRQVLFNCVSAVMATTRWLGAVLVVKWVSTTVEAFFVWQAATSIATIVVFSAITYCLLPKAERAARFSFKALTSVWQFAGGMMVITFLSILLTQADKLILSNLLSLSDYGYYTLAATVAGGLYTLIGPVVQAYYPRLCELHVRQDHGEMIKAFHTGAQLVSVIAGSAGLVVAVFAQDLLSLWTQNANVARTSGPLLSILVLGNLLNGLMWIPYQAQLAHGWTSLAILANTVALVGPEFSPSL